MAEIKKISTELQLLDKFLDTSGDAGTSGQVLTSTGTGINWVSAGTPGSGVYLPLIGGTMTGTAGVLMPDNFKLKFGDATTPDLEIYHDGSHSRIKDAGAGSLTINATDFVVNNSADTKNMIIAVDGGATTLFCNGANRLATTSTGVAVTGNGIFTGNVGIGTTSPGSKLEVKTSGTNTTVELDNSDTDYTVIQYNAQGATKGFSGFNAGFMLFGGEAGVTTRLQAGGSYAATILTNGNFGIGTTSPSALFSVANTTVINGNGTAGWGSSANYGFLTWDGGTVNAAIVKGQNGKNLHLGAHNRNDDLVITIAGNVGIGTTGPNQGGAASASTVVSTKASASGGVAITELIGLGNNDNDKVGVISFMSQNATSALADIRGLRHTSDTTGKLVFFTSGSEKMRIDQAGNVGIGTTSPGQKLSISSNSSGQTDVSIGNTGNGVSRLYIDASNGDVSGSDYIWFGQNNDLTSEIQITQNAGSFSLKSTPSGSTQTNFTMTQAGNIGIGTTSPSQKLHVHSTSSDGIIRVSGDNILNSGGEIKGFNNGFAFNVAPSGGGTYVERMRINGLGNVGIGDASPTSISSNTFSLSVNSSRNDLSGALISKANGTVKHQQYWDSSGYSFNLSANSGNFQFNGSNVGIGTTSPSAKLSVVGDINFGGGNNDGIIEVSGSGDLIFKYKGSDPALTLDGGAVKAIVHNRLDALSIVTVNNSTNNESILNIRDNDTSSNGHIAFENSSEVTGIVSSGTDFINFRVGDGVGMTATPVLTLEPSQVGIGTTSPGSLLEIEGTTNSSTSSLLRLSRAAQGSSPEKVAGFYSGTSGEKGYITVSNFGTAYNTSSDYRLKENIKPIDNSVERLMSLKPCNFNFISEDEDKIVMDGFIAHEAKEVVPESVTGIKDAVDEEGNPAYQGIDQSKLVPLLTAALQEALQRIEILEQKINN